jgi:hypothetical protein
MNLDYVVLGIVLFASLAVYLLAKGAEKETTLTLANDAVIVLDGKIIDRRDLLEGSDVVDYGLDADGRIGFLWLKTAKGN